MLLSGPDLANNLIGVLMRFRLGKIGLISDIEAMFHQIKIPVDDRDSLRFLWWPDGNLESAVTQYRMTSHLFGAISSPSIANFALQRTVKDFSDEFDKDVLDTVLNNFYVDDCLRSVDTEEEASSLVKNLVEICRLGGFHLHKWISNSPTVMQSIPETERGSCNVVTMGNNESIIERALGVNWNLASDCLTFKINVGNQPYTRRGLLSIISSIFDPLGFASPALLYPKLLLQELCQKGISWDQSLDEVEYCKWFRWLSDLPKLESIHIPRCVKPSSFKDVISIQLHNFADASNLGYGIACYLRLVDTKGSISCSLILGKSRVTPLKKITIPRLELTAATVAVKLSKKIIDQLKCQIDSVFYWTDSTTVLGYISNISTRFQTFVANRLSVIREATTLEQWRKVNTEDNPADDASRGLSIRNLTEKKRWFNGPEFLCKTEEYWPSDHTLYIVPESDPEVKKSVNVALIDNSASIIDKLTSNFSDWNRLKKATAWLLWCKNFLRYLVQKRNQPNVKKPDLLLTTELFELAEFFLIKYEQHKYLADTFSTCLKNTQERNQKKLKESRTAKLDPFLDSNGVLRVGGRLSRAEMSLDSKHQIILPKESRLSELIIRHTHSSVGHLGKNTILSEIRRKYWIIGSAKIIKSIISSCIICRRNTAKTNQQKMSDLPLNRVTPDLPPFHFCGMDFFGPIGVVFSCFNSRAIHIELANSMDTDSCINCIRRFIARRGKPMCIRSDNGSNIVGAVNELKKCLSELNQKKINGELLQKGIKWEFNPPAASHFGGVWERMIRTIRKVLYSLLREQSVRLDDESLGTLLCEVESILNCRPLTKLSESSEDLDALTPNHLLLIGSRSNVSPVITDKSDMYVLQEEELHMAVQKYIQ